MCAALPNGARVRLRMMVKREACPAAGPLIWPDRHLLHAYINGSFLINTCNLSGVSQSFEGIILGSLLFEAAPSNGICNVPVDQK
jgi:hypothetical protein